MCWVIITTRSLFWTLLSTSIVLGHLVALMTSQWLLGSEEEIQAASSIYSVNGGNTTGPVDVLDQQDVTTYTPTLGIFMRCAQIYRAVVVKEGDAGYGGPETTSTMNQVECTSYIHDFMDLPSGFWRAMAVFYGAGFFTLLAVAVLSIFSFCFRGLCKKSLFTVCGFVQAIAGLLILVALILYPAGWGSERVQELCGPDADPFQVGDCSVGWSFFVAIGSTVATFLCAVLSVQADIATSGDNIQDEISKGKYIICVP